MVEDGLPTGSVVNNSFGDPLLKVLEGEGEVGGTHHTFLGLQEVLLEDGPIVNIEAV